MIPGIGGSNGSSGKSRAKHGGPEHRSRSSTVFMAAAALEP